MDPEDPDSPGFRDDNVIFTRGRAEAARERIKKKLRMEDAREPSALEERPESERQLSPLEERLMRALGLKDVRELDEMLAKPSDSNVELGNEPPEEKHELLEREYEEQDRVYEEERAKRRAEDVGGKPDDSPRE